MMLKAAITNYQKFMKEIDNYSERKTKAGYDAARIAGFRLRKMLKEHIKAGRLPGQQIPLTELAKRSRSKAMRDKPPLFKLHFGIGYQVEEPAKGFKMDIGFVERVSSSWRKIAWKQQEGHIFSADEPRFKGNIPGVGAMTHRMFLARKGSAGKTGRKVYALRADTTQLKIPSRPLIRPFWAKYQRSTWLMVEKFFEQKMQGKEIKGRYDFLKKLTD